MHHDDSLQVISFGVWQVDLNRDLNKNVLNKLFLEIYANRGQRIVAVLFFSLSNINFYLICSVGELEHEDDSLRSA